jgi:hypothetical protein
MRNEDVVFSLVEPMQTELEYGGAFGSLLTKKTTPTHLVHSKCPTGVALEDVTKVTKLLQLKKELQFFCKSKIRSLKLNYVVASNKLLGTKYNKEDKKKNNGGGTNKINKGRTNLIKSSKGWVGRVKDVVCAPNIHFTHSLPFTCLFVDLFGMFSNVYCIGKNMYLVYSPKVLYT